MKIALNFKAINKYNFRFRNMRFLFFLIVSILSLSLWAQDDIKVNKLPKFSVRASVGIPKVVSSKALRSSFSAVVSSDIGVNYNLFSSFFVGIGYSHIYFQSQKHFREQFVNTNMQMQNGYLKIGYDHFFSDRGFTTIGLNAGSSSTKYSGIVYKADSLKGKYTTGFSSSYAEPFFGVNFLVEPNFGFGGFISYHYNFSQFNPAYPGFDKWLDYSRISNKWSTSMITVGFGFYYGIGKVK